MAPDLTSISKNARSDPTPFNTLERIMSVIVAMVSIAFIGHLVTNICDVRRLAFYPTRIEKLGQGLCRAFFEP